MNRANFMHTERLKTPVTMNDHRIGPINAPVVLIEYGCYECIRCVKANQWLQDILKEFKNDLCYVYRHFPLTDIHPNAALACMAAEAAALKNKFWEMHKMLYENSRYLSGEFIIHLAEGIGIDVDSFILDLDRTDLMDNICNNIVSGEDSGVSVPPTFFLNNKRMEGKIDYEKMRKEIYRELDNRNIGQASTL